jgi:hypothetical protein
MNALARLLRKIAVLFRRRTLSGGLAQWRQRN